MPESSLRLPGMRAFAINLERRHDRREKVEKLAQELELDFTLVTAMDGRDMSSRQGSQSEMRANKSATFDMQWPSDPDGTVNRAQVKLDPRRPELDRWTVLGCLLSHQNVLRAIQAENLDHALVLEDDGALTLEASELQQRFADAADIIVERCPDWQIIFLGGVLGFTPAGFGGEKALRIPGTQHLVSAKSTYQAHAYIVRRTVVDKICAKLEQGFAADAALVSMIHAENKERDVNTATSFRFAPALISQGHARTRDSDIITGPPIRRKRKVTTVEAPNPEINKEEGDSSERAAKQPRVTTEKKPKKKPGVVSQEPPEAMSRCYCHECTLENPDGLLVCKARSSPPAADPGGLEWSCGQCTFENSIMSGACEVCDLPRSEYTIQPFLASLWVCQQCTLENPSANATCGVCGALPSDHPEHHPPTDGTKPLQVLSEPSCFARPTHSLNFFTETAPCNAASVWDCQQCTLENPSANATCGVCGALPGDHPEHQSPPDSTKPPEAFSEFMCFARPTNSMNFSTETTPLRVDTIEPGNAASVVDISGTVQNSGANLIACVLCTLENPQGDTACRACGTQLPVTPSKATEWVCAACTLQNSADRGQCGACSCPKA